jgi:predicted ATP-grasp superfamily ATP-dependent carboligase
MNALIANAKSEPALAVIRSLGRKGIEITGATDYSSDFPMFSRYCRKKILLRTNSDDIESFTDELLQIVKNNHFDVFIPIMKQDLLFALAKRKNDFEKYTRLALATFEHLSLLTNKEKVSSLLDELGFSGPQTYVADSMSDFDTIQREASFPLFIKPSQGEGSRGVKIIADPKELANSYHDIKTIWGPVFIQELIHGAKYAAVFLLNKKSEAVRFFVQRVIRDYPISGGPACCMESVEYAPIYEIGMTLLKKINYTGIVEIEFIIDAKDGKPKIIDINPRFYGSVQCAVSSGVDFPLAVFNMEMNGDIEKDLSYKVGVVSRHLLFADTNHLLSVLKGAKSPRYNLGKMATLINYLNFFRDDSDLVISISDPRPAIKKIFRHI